MIENYRNNPSASSAVGKPDSEALNWALADLPPLRAIDVVLEPGMVLFIPPFWIHYVSAIDTR